MDENIAADIEKMRQAGASPVRLAGLEKVELQSRFASAGAEWASELDRRGKPGTEVLKAFKEAVTGTGASRP
jgi:hypothetical protein